MIRFLLLFFSIILISCTNKKEKKYSIQGQISPVNVAYLLLKQQSDIERKEVLIIDTIQISKEGKFYTNKNLEPHFYTLQIDAKNSIPLAISKDQSLNITIDNSTIKITGSKDTDALNAYEIFRKKSLDSLVQSVRRKVKIIKESEHPDEEKIKNLEQLEVINYEKHLDELNNYIVKNMGTTLGLYATSIRWKGAKNLLIYDSLVTAFEGAHPTLGISKKLREKVSRLQQTSVGGKAANIEMKTADGTKISLITIHKKLTLIDFWASWCGPCRSESKVLHTLYTKYHDKGFEIYGVSLDNKRDKWLKAIEKDRRIWTNVSSLEEFKTKAAFDYAVTSLPMNYLIDSNHKIVGKNLHEKELESLLIQLLEK